MFELFPWNPMLETGIGIVDTQHRRLVELLNQLARMYVDEADPASMATVLDGLSEYAQEHFRTEEAIWRAALPADSEALQAHEAAHAGFVLRMQAAEAPEPGRSMPLRELLMFLSGWLAEHILQDDRRMALTLHALQRGESRSADGVELHDVGSTDLVMQAALDMYRQLSAQTLALLQERQQRQELTQTLAALNQERERQSVAVTLAGMLLVSDTLTLPADLQVLVGRIGQTLGASRCFLHLYNADRSEARCHAEWCAPGVRSALRWVGLLREAAALEVWGVRLRERGEIRIADAAAVPAWAQLGQSLLRRCGMHSLCAVSLRHRSAFLGWLMVDTVHAARDWSNDEVQWLQLLGSLVGSALLRQRAEQQARTLLDAVPTGVAAAGIDDRRLLFCNDAFCALVRATRDELLGKDVTELHPLSEGMRVEREFSELAARGAQPLLTMEVCRPDGSRFLAEIAQVRIELDSGPVALAVFTDITRRHAAETALKASEQRLEQQVRTRTAELAEANRRLELAGERMRGLLDLSRQLHTLTEPQLLEQGLELSVQLTSSRDGYLHFLSADGHRIELCAWAASSRAACTAQVPGHYAIEQAGIWADAARRRMPVMHNVFPAESGRCGMPEGHVPVQRHLCVPVLDGESVRMLIGVGNKSEPYDEHDSEQLQLIANGIWGLLLRHRAASALAAARDAAEQASRAKSTFLASMSHEIRTPLNAVIGFAQVLGRDPSIGPRQREQVQIIARSGEHLLQLVNDVLDLSKIEAGQLRWLPVPFNPALLLEEVARLYGLRAAERGLRFTIEGLTSLPAQVLGDAGKLRQILLNLLGNALKFTVQGGITLRTLADPIEVGGWRLRVEVIDTGPGIGPEEQARLFTPFQQGAAGERMGGGTGLGLSISRRLAALSGGTLELDSTPGQGSRFRLELPLGAGDPESTEPLASRSSTPMADAAEPVAVVELDPDLRLGMQDAIHAGDMARLRVLIDQLAGRQPSLAAQLRALVQRYDYERLETLLR